MTATLKSIIISSFSGLKKVSSIQAQKYLFIIGHMRSGSSLMLHLLVNHPELVGSGENNASYHQTRDLHKLELKSRIAQKTFFKNYSFVVDQINHNKFTSNFKFLNQQPIHFLFLIRKPIPTISSILRLSDQFYNGKWTEEMAINYYCDRLNGMEKLYSNIDQSKNVKVVKYEDLVQNPITELSSIQNKLGLSSSFSTDYNTYAFTGKKGDPSENIRKGSVAKIDKPIHSTISSDDLKKLNKAYEDCLHHLNL